MIDEDRYFNNRDITYQFIYVGSDYPERKTVENYLKNKLMPKGIGIIKDSHDNDLHWLGKCKSVTVDDNQKNQKLTATIDFDCYPFAISDYEEGNDIWDVFNFEDDIAQITKYEINGYRNINLVNLSSHSTEVTIIVTGNISITGSFGSLDLKDGTYKDTIISLVQGGNTIKLDGRGTINFQWFKEVMI